MVGEQNEREEALDLGPLQRALERCTEGLLLLRERPGESIIRDGVIQRFEFTYELAHKTLRRYLRMTLATPGVLEEMAFQDLIRTGYAQGLLLHSWEQWRGFRQCRTNTSHAYDEVKAQRVVESVPAFVEEVRFLLAALRRRADGAG